MTDPELLAVLKDIHGSLQFIGGALLGLQLWVMLGLFKRKRQ